MKNETKESLYWLGMLALVFIHLFASATIAAILIEYTKWYWGIIGFIIAIQAPKLLLRYKKRICCCGYMGRRFKSFKQDEFSPFAYLKCPECNSIQ